MASRRTTATFGAGLVLVASMAALGACGDGSSDGELASDGGDAGSARDAGSSDASRTPSRDGDTG